MSQTRELTDKNIKETIKEGKHMVMFSGSWCPVCKQMRAILPLLGENAYEMNVDKSPHTPIEMNVLGTPSFILFEDGKEKGRIVGAQPFTEIQKLMD